MVLEWYGHKANKSFELRQLLEQLEHSLRITGNTWNSPFSLVRHASMRWQNSMLISFSWCGGHVMKRNWRWVVMCMSRLAPVVAETGQGACK